MGGRTRFWFTHSECSKSVPHGRRLEVKKAREGEGDRGRKGEGLMYRDFDPHSLNRRQAFNV